MSEDFEAPKDDLENGLPEGSEGHSDYKPADTKDVKAKYQLSGMYQNWFLDYASYVILERAVPHINDGLKPVQRRILHSMRRLEDGRYNKVANIVGHTMQFHPHGDAFICLLYTSKGAAVAGLEYCLAKGMIVGLELQPVAYRYDVIAEPPSLHYIR